MTADYYFEYDANQRVSKEIIQGGSRTFSSVVTVSNNTAGYNSWLYKTAETLPDGNVKTVYSNFAAQPMLKVFSSTDGNWSQYFQYDDTGRVILKANRSAVSGFDDSFADLVNWQGGTALYLKTNSGLIRTYTYDSASGYKSANMLQQGQSGLPIILKQYEYIACCPSTSSSSSSSSTSSGNSSSSGAPCPNPVYFISKIIKYPDDG